MWAKNVKCQNNGLFMTPGMTQEALDDCNNLVFTLCSAVLQLLHAKINVKVHGTLRSVIGLTLSVLKYMAFSK